METVLTRNTAALVYVHSMFSWQVTSCTGAYMVNDNITVVLAHSQRLEKTSCSTCKNVFKDLFLTLIRAKHFAQCFIRLMKIIAPWIYLCRLSVCTSCVFSSLSGSFQHLQPRRACCARRFLLFFLEEPQTLFESQCLIDCSIMESMDHVTFPAVNVAFFQPLKQSFPYLNRILFSCLNSIIPWR